ncbi:MAG: PP2C family protein-serine/threonine phosphatase [Planctomycetota bacterium]
MSDLQRAETAAGAVQGRVHRVGAGEIRETRQGEVVVFSTHGRCSTELLEALEHLVERCVRDAGLDFRALQDPGPEMLPVLRRLNQRFAAKKRVLLLYSPPSRLLDLLRLRNALGDFNVYQPDSGIKRRAENPASGPATPPQTPATAPETIVSFTHDLDRTRELESSLDIAGRRAGRMLHKWQPEFPPYDVSATYLPNDKVGGDFFQLLPLAETRLGIAIGDVAGHGLEAALLMGMVRKVLEIRASDDPSLAPEEVLNQVNVDLYPDLDRFTFITALYGVLDRDTGTFRYGRAGHNYPLLVSRRLRKARELPGAGIAFGIDSGSMFKQALSPQTVTMEPGDLLVFYTDGVIEAAHPRRGQLGLERLMMFLDGIDLDLPAADIKELILAELRSFIDGAPLSDDLTLICVKRPLSAASAFDAP